MVVAPGIIWLLCASFILFSRAVCNQRTLYHPKSSEVMHYLVVACDKERLVGADPDPTVQVQSLTSLEHYGTIP